MCLDCIFHWHRFYFIFISEGIISVDFYNWFFRHSTSMPTKLPYLNENWEFRCNSGIRSMDVSSSYTTSKCSSWASGSKANIKARIDRRHKDPVQTNPTSFLYQSILWWTLLGWILQQYAQMLGTFSGSMCCQSSSRTGFDFHHWVIILY